MYIDFGLFTFRNCAQWCLGRMPGRYSQQCVDAVRDEFAEREQEEISKHRVSAIFAEVAEEAEKGSSKCKLSSLSV